jgi:hypothetical protein
VRFSKVTKLPAEFVTLLLPRNNVDSGEDRLVRLDSLNGKSTNAYRFTTAGAEHDFVFAQGKTWSLARWKSDAEFFYWAQNKDKTQRMLICCNVSNVEAGGRTIISSKHSLLRCEIILVDGQARVVSSDQDVVVNKDAFMKIADESDAGLIDSPAKSC